MQAAHTPNPKVVIYLTRAHCVAEDDKVNRYIKFLVRRSQFGFDELRKMFIDCRKHSKTSPEISLDKAQFTQVMKRYGYSSETIGNHLFDIFDSDHSNTIDFEEMILGA